MYKAGQGQHEQSEGRLTQLEPMTPHNKTTKPTPSPQQHLELLLRSDPALRLFGSSVAAPMDTIQLSDPTNGTHYKDAHNELGRSRRPPTDSGHKREQHPLFAETTSDQSTTRRSPPLPGTCCARRSASCRRPASVLACSESEACF